MSRTGRVALPYLVLFATLYAVQGVVVAYLFNFNKPYMEQSGLRGDAIGDVQTLALLPIALKFLVGPLSDRVNLLGLGHRRPYIVLGLLVQAAGLIGLAVIDPFQHLSAFAAMAVLAVVGLAFYDTSCDGMVVDVTPPEARARVQGMLWTSRFIAATVFTLGFGAWLDRLGGARYADRLLWASAGLTTAPVLLALFLKEPERAADAEVFQWSALGVMLRRRALILLAFGSLYSLAGMGVESNLSLYYQRLGFGGGGEVGTLGASRNLGRAVGAVLLPLALARFGRRGVLTVGVVGLATAIAGQTLIHTRLEAGAWGFLFGGGSGWNDALFAFLAMEAADPRMAASTFALFMAVTNLSVLGDAFFAHSVTHFGQYRLPFLGAALVVLAAWPLTRPLSRPAGPREPHDVTAR